MTRPIGYVTQLSSGVWLGRGIYGPTRVAHIGQVRIFPSVSNLSAGLAKAAHLCEPDASPVIYPVLVGQPMTMADLTHKADEPGVPEPPDISDLVGRLYRDRHGAVWRLEARNDGGHIYADTVGFCLRRRNLLGRWGVTTEGVGPDRLAQLLQEDQITQHDGTVRFARITDEEDADGTAA